RRVRDALDDLSALIMECRRRGRNDVAAVLAAAYGHRTTDAPPHHLEAFYRSLHATSRAREAAVVRDSSPRNGQLVGVEFQSYLDQAMLDLRNCG
ncbi:MAG TPA: hypothetical protein PJ982_09160, partial [Lacipirellulaceae bacterium]|nr:hypothetical protein [Lacipirellulaceae bacterium]